MGGDERKSDLSLFEDQSAWLLRTIGKYLENNWGVNGTGASTGWKVRKTFKAFGYHCPAGEYDFNMHDVLESLSQGRPVLMSGFSEKIRNDWVIVIFDSYNGGHAWVVDGRLDRERDHMFVDLKTREVRKLGTHRSTLLHCNWGWYGGDNGYFLSYVFDANRPIVKDQSMSEGRDYFYQFQVKNRPYIYK